MMSNPYIKRSPTVLLQVPATGSAHQQCPVQPERGPGRRWRPPQQASGSAPALLPVPLDEERVEGQRLSRPLPRPGEWGVALGAGSSAGDPPSLRVELSTRCLVRLPQGLGLFAARDIEKQTMMIEYNGTVLRNEVAVSKEKIYRLQVRSLGTMPDSSLVIKIIAWDLYGKTLASQTRVCLFDCSGWVVFASGEYKV